MVETYRRYIKKQRVLLVGAGEAGRMITREITSHPEDKYIPVGLLDDDKTLLGEKFSGVEVLGSIDDLPSVVDEFNVEEVLITIPSASGQLIRKITELCNKAKVSYRILPGIFSIVYGDARIEQIRDVEVEDLLRREPINLDIEKIASFIEGKRIFITGAGGSIGSELCRQLASFEPESLMLLGHGENSIYNIEMELNLNFPRVFHQPIIGDIRDRDKIDFIFRTYKPELVFHTAAHKHVELMEKNPAEAVKNNIEGTKILAELTDKYNVSRFVLISTDKAVNPTCTMGATKKVAEWIVQMIDDESDTRFITVRFGNVLGSRGSVIEMFKKQIDMGGPLTITDTKMKRYFMTISEAVQLVIQATSIGEGGDVLILEVGEPMSIISLAKELIHLSGKNEDEVPIKYIGRRKGEKLCEVLIGDDEEEEQTEINEIRKALPPLIDEQFLHNEIEALIKLAHNMDIQGLKKRIAKIIPTYEV
jgi:FlaA1/EpsC-like NDP-sugar epimerase